MASSFTGLDAYTRARSLSGDLRAAIASWSSFDKWSIGIQLVRSADSIGANIAEATGRWHTPDRRRFLVIARGSLCETEHWLLIAEDSGLLPPGSSSRVEQIARPLSGLINRAPPS